jgi:hypothetical protein
MFGFTSGAVRRIELILTYKQSASLFALKIELKLKNNVYVHFSKIELI